MILGGLLTGVLPELGFQFIGNRTTGFPAAGVFV
jgi:hypothetical protein